MPATVLGRATIPESVDIETIPVEKLAVNWFAASAPPQLQGLGGEWLERGETAVLKVPSAIVTEEWNYLLNPLHMDFHKCRIAVPKSEYDMRMF